MSKQSFADLGVSDAVVRALARAGGAQDPFDVQRSVVPDVSPGTTCREVPDRVGKTLAFGVPLVERMEAKDSERQRPRARAHVKLATKVNADLEVAGPGALARYRLGGVGIEKQKGKLCPKAHIVVATPGVEDLDAAGRSGSIPSAYWCST